MKSFTGVTWAPESPEAAERSISVIVTALNEEGNLRPTVEAITGAVAGCFDVYEVIVIDDGSDDDTPRIADALASENPSVRVHHNPQNMGLAYSYRKGISLARHRYTSWIAGNNLVPPAAFEKIYDQVGKADVVITYLLRDVRGPMRRLVSSLFTRVMNLLFGTQLRYFTGPCVYTSQVARQLDTVTEGSMFVAEMLLRLIASGQSYVQVGIQPMPRSSGATKTFRLKNLVAVFLFVVRLFWELRLMPGSGMSLWRNASAVGSEVEVS